MRARQDFDRAGVRARRRRARATILGSWLAMALALASGCAVLPRRPTPQAVPAPPQVPQNATGPVPVVLTETADEKGD